MENIVLLTFDSCRYDVLVSASMPVLRSRGTIRRATTPGTFTYPAHQAFFEGMLPLCEEPVPYYNRFVKQLYGVLEVGGQNVVKDARLAVSSHRSFFDGLRERGYSVVGCGAMTWFKQESLIGRFDEFLFTGTSARAQIKFLLERAASKQPFFGFINFGETHYPYVFETKTEPCKEVVLAREIRWPPVQSGAVGQDCPAYWEQVAAAEFLDGMLAPLFAGLPQNTVVIVCGDHGECFGEDGYWGHGVSHLKVHEVPLAIFRLDGAELV